MEKVKKTRADHLMLADRAVEAIIASEKMVPLLEQMHQKRKCT